MLLRQKAFFHCKEAHNYKNKIKLLKWLPFEVFIRVIFRVWDIGPKVEYLFSHSLHKVTTLLYKVRISILLQLCKVGEKGRHSTLDPSQSQFGTHNSNFWLLKVMYRGQCDQILKFFFINLIIFFIFLKDLFYNLCLSCNTSHYLMIFFFKLIKNS